MKKIEAIIRPAKVGDVCTALDRLGHPGVMITELEGHGRQKGIEQSLHGKTFKCEFLPKVMIQIITPDDAVEKIASAIKAAAYTGEMGDGKVFIYPVDEAIRIRTGERGDAAL